MKVNMALVSDEDEKLDVAGMEAEAEADAETESQEDEELDESDKHSKLKTFLLVAAMVGGLGLFVWNMTGLVNNMRLDNQGFATNIVYEMQELGDFMDSSEGSGATAVGDVQESEVSTDAARDGPVSELTDSGGSGTVENTVVYADESEEMAALRQEMQNVRNEMALKEQELKNAEDMLDSSLTRESEKQAEIDNLQAQLEKLQSQIDALTGGN